MFCMHFFTDKKPPSGGFFLCTAKQGSRETDDLSPGSSPPVARGLYLAPPTLFHGSTLKSGFQENWRFLNGILTEHSQMYPRARGRTSQSRPLGGWAALARFDNRPPGRRKYPTVAGASGRVSLRAAGAAKLLLRTKTQTTLSPNKL